MLKHLLTTAIIAILSLTTTQAQRVISLYEGKAPGSESWTWSGAESTKNMFQTRVVYNVSALGMGAIAKQVVPANAPPLFVCAASDDQLKLAPHSTKLYNDWITAGKPSELHMYAKGGHGFGMRKQNLPTDSWIDRSGEWLALSGFLKK